MALICLQLTTTCRCGVQIGSRLTVFQFIRVKTNFWCQKWGFCILRPIWEIKVCNPPILGIPNSFCIPVWTHGTLIHHLAMPAADSAFWLASGKNRFFGKKSIFVIFRPQGARFHENTPFLRVPNTLRTLVCHQVSLWGLQKGAAGCCLSNFSTMCFSRGLKMLFLGKLARTGVQYPKTP